MNGHSALAGAAGLISLALAAATFERWLRKPSRHLAAWSIALLLFAGGAMAAWFGAATGWSEPAFRAFYLLGAILNVPVLGVGSIYLLKGRAAGDKAAAVVALLSAFAIGVIWAAPVRGGFEAEVLPRGSEVFGYLPRVLATGASSSGAIVVFAGAVWSIYKRRRVTGEERPSRHLALGNGLLAFAIVILSVGGLFNSVADEMTTFSISLTAGAAFLFAGFLVSTSQPAREQTAEPSNLQAAGLGDEASTKLDKDVHHGGEQDCDE